MKFSSSIFYLQMRILHCKLAESNYLRFRFRICSTQCERSLTALNLMCLPQMWSFIDGSRGRRRRPPNRIQFFRFRTHFRWKAYASEVGAPPNGTAPPPTGNPGSATVFCLFLIVYLTVIERNKDVQDTENTVFIYLINDTNLWSELKVFEAF